MLFGKFIWVFRFGWCCSVCLVKDICNKVIKFWMKLDVVIGLFKVVGVVSNVGDNNMFCIWLVRLVFCLIMFGWFGVDVEFLECVFVILFFVCELDDKVFDILLVLYWVCLGEFWLICGLGLLILFKSKFVSWLRVCLIFFFCGSVLVFVGVVLLVNFVVGILECVGVMVVLVWGGRVLGCVIGIFVCKELICCFICEIKCWVWGDKVFEWVVGLVLFWLFNMLSSCVNVCWVELDWFNKVWDIVKIVWWMFEFFNCVVLFVDESDLLGMLVLVIVLLFVLFEGEGVVRIWVLGILLDKVFLEKEVVLSNVFVIFDCNMFCNDGGNGVFVSMFVIMFMFFNVFFCSVRWDVCWMVLFWVIVGILCLMVGGSVVLEWLNVMFLWLSVFIIRFWRLVFFVLFLVVRESVLFIVVWLCNEDVCFCGVIVIFMLLVFLLFMLILIFLLGVNIFVSNGLLDVFCCFIGSEMWLFLGRFSERLVLFIDEIVVGIVVVIWVFFIIKLVSFLLISVSCCGVWGVDWVFEFCVFMMVVGEVFVFWLSMVSCKVVDLGNVNDGGSWIFVMVCWWDLMVRMFFESFVMVILVVVVRCVVRESCLVIFVVDDVVCLEGWVICERMKESWDVIGYILVWYWWSLVELGEFLLLFVCFIFVFEVNYI